MKSRIALKKNFISEMTMEQSTPGTAAAAVDDNRRRQQLRLRQRLKEMVTAAAAAAQTVYLRITI